MIDMKRILKISVVAVAALLSVTSAEGQSRISYFMRGSAQRYDLNPALSPSRGYLSLPVVGNLGVNLESNFLSAENLLYPNGEGNGLVTYMHKSVSAEEFLAKLPDMNSLEFGLNDQIFAIGNYFRGGAGFWSFGIRLRSETNLDIPKDFFALTKTLSQGTYNISGMGLETNNFIEASMGYTFPVMEQFTLGFRAKLLLGVARAKANINKMDISISEESYRAEMAGTIETNIAGYNFEGMNGEVTLEQFTSHLTDFSNFDPSNISSVGFAFDAGIEWTFRDEQIRLSAAINDLGYNAWGANSNFCATIDNVNFAFNGYDIATNEVKIEQPEEIKFLSQPNEGATTKTKLHASIVAGLEYNFLDDVIGVGALWNTKMYENRSWNSIGGIVTLRPATWFTTSVGYSYVNSLGVLGFALNVHSSVCNIFCGMDYIATKYGTANGGAIPVPINQNSVNLAFGISIPLNPRMF